MDLRFALLPLPFFGLACAEDQPDLALHQRLRCVRAQKDQQAQQTTQLHGSPPPLKFIE